MRKSIYRAIGLIFLCVIAILSLSGCSPILELNQKYAHSNITINYKSVVSTEIEEYINMDVLSKEDQDYVRKHTSVVYHGKKVAGKKYDKPGNYSLTIYYNNQVYRRYTVTVRDCEAPKFTKAKDVYTFNGTEYTDEELEELLQSMFQARDNSGKVTIQLTHDKISMKKAGDYVIHAKATDKVGNVSETKATFHVQNPKYGAKGTYVFVSISKQTLTYFVNGKVNMSTPVVTGTKGSHDTPKGTYFINSMSTGTRLKGEDFDVKVNYWMAFIGGEFGLHSAEWRSVFGGSIYQYSGSHGCVNMPVSAAGELYRKVSVGTPVIIAD